jgi:hypothetical protein
MKVFVGGLEMKRPSIDEYYVSKDLQYDVIYKI